MNYSLNFYLERPDQDAKSKEIKSIFYYLTWSGQRIRKSTGKKCRQCDWIESDRKGKVQRVDSKIEYSTTINPFLSEFEYKIERYFEKAGHVPEKDEVMAMINGEELNKTDLKALFQKFIDDSTSGARKTKKGKQIKGLTIKNYKQTFSILKTFEEEKKTVLKWSNINDGFYDKFTNYMWDDLDYYDNSVGSIIKCTKTFLNWCAEKEYIPNKLYSAKWIMWEEDIDIIVLYPDELSLLFNLEAPTDRLKRAKDVFLAGCMTCLRISNLLTLQRPELVGNKLKIISVKSDKPIMLDVSPLLMKIFDKYENLLPEISQQKFNDALKDLGKWLEEHILTKKDELKPGFVGNAWGQKIFRTRYKRGVPIRIPMDTADMITSHTMRRTGITNLLMMGLSEIEVKSISGHSLSSDDFAKYVKIAEQFISKKSNDAWSKIAQK